MGVMSQRAVARDFSSGKLNRLKSIDQFFDRIEQHFLQ
jgi:hypothetical protein